MILFGWSTSASTNPTNHTRPSSPSPFLWLNWDRSPELLFKNQLQKPSPPLGTPWHLRLFRPFRSWPHFAPRPPKDRAMALLPESPAPNSWAQKPNSPRRGPNKRNFPRASARRKDPRPASKGRFEVEIRGAAQPGGEPN